MKNRSDDPRPASTDVAVRRSDDARLRALSELAIRAGLADDLAQTYEAALQGIDEALGATRASILLFDASNVVRFVAHRGLSETYRQAVEGHTPWKPEDADAVPILVEDVEKDATLADYLPVFRAEGIRALGFVPLVHGGRVLGKFMVYHAQPHRFPEEEVHTARAIAGTVAAAITRRRAEENVRRAAREFQALVEAIPQMVWTATAEGKLDYHNRRWQEYTGFDLMRSAGEGWRDAIHPEDRERCVAGWLRCVRTGEPYEMEIRLLGRDGAYRWHLSRATPVRDGTRILRWFGTSTDIHEHKRALEELALARTEMARSEKLSALGSLVSGVAHEIRTPLTIIENNVHVLSARVQDPAFTPEMRARLAEPMEEISAGVERAARLVGELRRFTKLGPQRRLRTDLREAIDDALRLFQATHRADAPVVADLQPVRPVHADRSQVQQVALNLLQNAVDATHGGGRVRLRLYPEEDAAVLVVEDDGVGMDARTQAHMFEPLFTTKNEGTGLGLSIVKRILDEHGAHVECESGPGKGTRFTIRFPFA